MLPNPLAKSSFNSNEITYACKTQEIKEQLFVLLSNSMRVLASIINSSTALAHVNVVIARIILCVHAASIFQRNK